MENIGRCVGAGHSNPITLLIAMEITGKTLTVLPETPVPTSYVLERRKPEPHGFGAIGFAEADNVVAFSIPQER
jgi:hypothetical protein